MIGAEVLERLTQVKPLDVGIIGSRRAGTPLA
jgi:hypothetical protein